MKLGFHYHIPAYVSNGKIFMPSYLGVFIDSLSIYYDEIILFLHKPREDELDTINYQINSSNISLVSLCTHNSIPARYLQTLKFLSILKKNIKKIDLILIRASTPLLPVFYLICKKPLVLLLVSKANEGLDMLPQNKIRLFFIKIWANLYQNIENNIARKNLTIVNSAKIFEELKKNVKYLHKIKTTTLSKGDFYQRDDTCQNEYVSLLFTGRLSESKGLLDILESISILKNEGFNVHLDLVGMLSKSEDIIKKMNSKCYDLKLDNIFTYHGYKKVGIELLEFYRNSDIFINASKGSAEGFPRTLWEAMASSTPIVATSVSSIPYYLDGAAILVEPNNPKQMAEGIKTIIINSVLRKKIIKNGFSIAKENTIENSSYALNSIITNYISEKDDSFIP